MCAGKTTLTERILGFPVAVTKTGIGTTSPMIVMTQKLNMDSIKVKAYGDSTFIEYDKKDVMVWAQQQMDEPKKAGTNTIQISDKPIYIDASGSNYMNRRFVDLPGFQSNDEGNTGTREAILNLLQDEMQKPNTVVLCVEHSQFEYVNVIDARVTQNAEGVLLANFGGETNRIFGMDEPLGLRLVLDGVTVLMPTIFDPSEHRTDVTGKVVRYLQENGAEVEAMKMIMPIKATESGKITHNLSPRSTPSKVKKILNFKGSTIRLLSNGIKKSSLPLFS